MALTFPVLDEAEKSNWHAPEIASLSAGLWRRRPSQIARLRKKQSKTEPMEIRMH
jgi:hypothetical protein